MLQYLISAFEGLSSVIFVGTIFSIIFYGYLSTFGNQLGGDVICNLVDKAWDYGKWYIVFIFVSGCVVGWKQTFLLGSWSVIIWMISEVKKINNKLKDN